MRRLAGCVRQLVSFLVVFCILGLAALAEQPVVQPRILQQVDEAKRTVLKGNTHRLAHPRFDRGAAPADLPMKRMLLVLKRSPEQEAALRKLLDDQQDKASPSYHRWLTPEQFGKQFGPADEDIQTVTSWLQSHGFEIGNVAKGRNMIEFSGTAAQVQETFHTAIHKYVVNGEEHWANSNDPEIPTALAPVVVGVHTLHNFVKKPMLHFSPQKIPAKLVSQGPGKPPQVTFSTTPPIYALGPGDYAIIYNINSLYQAGINGQGSTIAVVGRSDLYQNGSDVSNFQLVFGTNPGFFNTIWNGPDPGDIGQGEEAEATLDVTWSSAIAPGADVDFVVSATTNTADGVDLSEAYIIDNNLGDVMTESFGTCEAYFTNAQAQGFATLAEQAAAQGITFMVSAGDAGAEGCDDPNSETVATGPVSVNILAATPFTVAVGGTMFNENGQDSKYWGAGNGTIQTTALSYIPEDVWNESCTVAQCGQNAGIWAGGGGASIFFPKPSWQSGVTGIPNDKARDLPDVSLTAAGHDPYLVCLEGSCVADSQGNIYLYFVSGTSASSPSFAGIMALVNQKMNARQGQADYVLYKLASSENLSQCNASGTSSLPASSCIFNDVTVGNNVVPGEKGSYYQSGAGYDLATGLGSVNVANLVNKWNTVTFNASTTTLSGLPTTSIQHGQPVTPTITVTGNGGTPTGDVSVLTSNNQSLGFFTLANGTVSPTISSFPGGTYTVTARYGGDGIFAPSTSSPSSITVTQEASNTALSVLTQDQNYNFQPFTGGPYGSFVYLRADVAGQSKQGIPTGSVNFMDGTNAICVNGCSFALNSQGNTATPNFWNSSNGGTPTGLYTLSVGQHSITANYQGDSSFTSSTSSPPANVTISQASTTSVVNYVGANQGATLTATVNTKSGGNPPTGTVTFSVNGAPVGNPVPVAGVPALTAQNGALQGAQATASYTASQLVNGKSYTVTAAYIGDTNYTASTAPAIKFTLQPDFSFVGSTNSVTVASPGQTGSLTLTITALDGYTGTINFSSSSCSGLPTGASCSFSPTSVAGSGTTTLTVTTTASTTGMLQPADHRGWGWWIATSGTSVAGLFLLGVPSRRRWRSTVLSLALYALLAAGAGCGGGNSNSSPPPPPPPPPATPAGSSNVVVTATSGSLTHTVSFTLNVQ